LLEASFGIRYLKLNETRLEISTKNVPLKRDTLQAAGKNGDIDVFRGQINVTSSIIFPTNICKILRIYLISCALLDVHSRLRSYGVL